MNELTELAKVRSDAPPMSAQARDHGRACLDAAMSPASRPRPRNRRRVLAIGLAGGLALTASVTGAVVIGAPGSPEPAAAATVLQNAAAALEADPDPVPRTDQYVFQEVRQKTSDSGPNFHIWLWSAADGSRPGRIRIVDESSSCETSCDKETTVPVYRPKDGLADAPYSVLAKLPTDPDALLDVLSGDPATRPTPSPAPLGPKVTKDLQVWSLLRDLAERMPSAQRAALYRAAAKLPGITVYPNITDAVGRDGVGVGMDDPRIGRVVLVFDRESHRNLGEVILDGDQVSFSRALLRTAVVDRIG